MFGGKLMDTFMDKLAQKLTAQEMIKANMAADAEEMNQLKEKNKEYAECLEQMQKLVEASVNKLENAKVDGSEINRLVEEGISKINQVRETTETQMNTEVLAALEELKELAATEPEVLQELKILPELQTLLNEVKTTSGDVKTAINDIDVAVKDVDAAVKAVDAAVKDVDTTVKAFDATVKNIENEIKEKNESVNDNIHKECVKVYRNVQAVVVEENGKQTETLTGTVNALKGKLNAILGVSIAALILALGSIVIQVMNLLNFKPF